MWTTINAFLKTVDNFVWGVPLMVLILRWYLTDRASGSPADAQASAGTQVDDQK